MRDLRVDEAAAVLCVSPTTLRAWEQRFGYPRSVFGAAGQRRYSGGEVVALRSVGGWTVGCLGHQHGSRTRHRQPNSQPALARHLSRVRRRADRACPLRRVAPSYMTAQRDFSFDGPCAAARTPASLGRSCGSREGLCCWNRPDPSVRGSGSARVLLSTCPLGPGYRKGDKGGVRGVRRVAFSRSRAKLWASRRRTTASAVSPDAGASRAGGQPTVEPRRPRRRPDCPTRGAASRRGPRTVGRPPGRAPGESPVSTFPTARPGCARAAA